MVHLHVHTQYSILDGQASIPKLVDKALKDGMRGMAVTDHGNMFGIKEFYNYVQKVNKGKAPGERFMPIFGCEVYCAHTSRFEKKDLGWHLILLAKNATGYHNLLKIVSHAYTEGFHQRPRTDHEEIAKYHEGLIACSACLAGEVPTYLREEKIDKAEESIEWFKSVFHDDYYLELQRHEVKDPRQRANRETFREQEPVNQQLIRLAKKHGVKLVATNDVHFVDEDNAEAHDRLICLSTNKDLNDPTRLLYSKQEWLKTQQEMSEIFSDIPEALDNTMEVLAKVEEYSIDHAPIMPTFPIPETFGTEEDYRRRFTEKALYDEFTRDENGQVILSEEEGAKKIQQLGGYEKLYRIKLEADYLQFLTLQRAKPIYGDPLPGEIDERIRFELHVMKTMGFPGYFLIVQDYINAAREQLGVWVGPGRGSAAGSVVAYCLGITRIDPLQYDLLFERFLNPDRISLPDIDVDFDDDGRELVLQWVTNKYGAEKVAHIITYGTMAAKLAIKDVARVQGVPLSVSNALCKAIPDILPDGSKQTLDNIIRQVPALADAATSPDPLLRDTIRFARMLEGNVRNTGVHACGTIICRDDISDWVPVSTVADKKTGERLTCTQYDGHVIEQTGLIKMDFLGLTTLSILKEAVEIIRDSLAVRVDVDHIPLDDPATYQLFCDGRTIGVFQFESVPMQKYLRQLQPSCLEDLIAMNALYRPGPMDYIPDFIDRKQGRKPIAYDIPVMEQYLKDTYGITVYQEQVMLLSRLLAGFTRGESDTLRKAMGKKQKAVLESLKPKFLAGGQAHGHDAKVLAKIWEDWEKFASYAFNKSHSTCYAWIAYQTAFLKAHFPAQYMAAVMNRSMKDIKEISKLMEESRAMGVETKGPDINESLQKFTVNQQGVIRFGMAAVKGVGAGAAEAVIEERRKGGPFKTVYDFFERVPQSACNRKSIESLILAGAFDGFADVPREAYFTDCNGRDLFLDLLMKHGQQQQSMREEYAHSLFGDLGMAEQVVPPPLPREIVRWTDMERLGKERDCVGLFLSAHPLDDYAVILKHICSASARQLDDPDVRERLSHQASFCFAGIVVDSKEKISKAKRPYGVVKLEDFEGSGEITLFGDDWVRYSPYFNKEKGLALFLRASMKPRRDNPSVFNLNVFSVELLSEVKDQLIRSLTIDLPLESLTTAFVDELEVLLAAQPGNASLTIRCSSLNGHHARLRAAKPIAVTKQLTDFLDQQERLSYAVNGE